MVTLRNPPPIFGKFDGVTGLLDLLWMVPVVSRIWIELATNHQWQGYAFDEAERWTFIALPPSCNVSAYSPRFLCKISEEHFGIFSTCPDDTINLDADDVLLIDLLGPIFPSGERQLQSVMCCSTRLGWRSHFPAAWIVTLDQMDQVGAIICKKKPWKKEFWWL